MYVLKIYISALVYVHWQGGREVGREVGKGGWREGGTEGHYIVIIYILSAIFFLLYRII